MPDVSQPAAQASGAQPAAVRYVPIQRQGELTERPLSEQEDGGQLLAARLVAARHPGQWGVGGDEITSSTINPPTTF